MKTRSKLMTLSTAAMIAAAPFAGFAAAPVNGAKIINEELLTEDATIAANAMKIQNLTTLVAALQEAGLADDLMGEGPYTVFAPTNEAFSKIPAEALDDLMKPENREALQAVLSTHVVAGELTPQMVNDMLSDDWADSEFAPLGFEYDVDAANDTLTVYTISGDPITIEKGPGSQLIIRDAQSNLATTLAKDIVQENGVMYFIDGVLMPVS
ncbi:fasciclin domain-containing protein [Celeribacter litoreus]|uniref:fasciclin domain-containing protein n=1 Tax=Celeribacter litoreus TaxID=2876714 RepID=UPI001CCEE9A5|nr:fasciclin domain-containing protein [Celeribacter litoreus]MCA0043774.1 fasciclin domain-containing protein [Celeribacter litoreus]